MSRLLGVAVVQTCALEGGAEPSASCRMKG